MNAEYKERLGHWIRTLADDFYEPLGEISFGAHKTMEQIPLQEAEKLSYTPVQPGWKWGTNFEYCWLKGSIVLPAGAEGKKIVLDLKPGFESCVFVNGEEFGTVRNTWVTTKHHYLVDNVLAESAKAGERYDLLLEAYAGQFYPEAPSLDNATGPVLPGSYQDPFPEGGRVTLGRSTFGIWNEDAYQLYLDVTTLRSLLTTLDETSLRAARIEEGLERFTRLVDFEQGKEQRIQDYRAARQALRPLLEAKNGSTAPTFYAIGNAHIDLAWLWTKKETDRKSERTFAAQLRHLKEYPSYQFLQSQPALYEMCRKHYPALYARIREAVREGRWIPEGAMWVEPDTNMPSGESLVRQLLYGKTWFRKEFGVDSEILWLPDSFGYSGALPQLLKDAGVRYLVTQKIFWSYNEGEEFPYHYFYWDGIDGSRVTAFLPTSYTYQTTPEEIGNVWKARRQKRDLDAFLLPYGYGDGGGGPTRDHIEYALRQENLEGGPRVVMKGPNEFFHDMEEKGGPKNTWNGELYFSAHRGTYTSQAKVKANNRQCEEALHELEFWNAAAADVIGKPALCSEEHLGDLWKQLLFNQFHDILPGSGIAEIYKDAEREVEEVIRTAREETEKVLTALAACGELTKWPAQGADDADLIHSKEETYSESADCLIKQNAVSVMNSQGFARREVVTLPEDFESMVVTADGTRLPVRDHKVLVEVPAAGSVVLYKAEGNLPAERPVTAEKSMDGSWILDNGILRAVITPSGEITSLIRRESGREFAASPMNHFRLFKDIPRKFDAWDIDSSYEEMEMPGLTDAKVSLLSCTELEAVLLLTGTFRETDPGAAVDSENSAEDAAAYVTDGFPEKMKKACATDSYIEQKIILYAGAESLRFETSVEWHALHRLLKVSFPAAVCAQEGINEIQYGYVKRPTVRSRVYDRERFEVCNHRYSVLCDGSHGTALLNDSKYGISMEDNRLELSLLRASAAPAMRADNGLQKFTYAICPFDGSFEESRVTQEAISLNEPLLVTGGAAPVESLFRISRPNIILDAVKLAEDGSGDRIVRLYESRRCDTTADFICRIPGRITACSILEQETGEELPQAEDGNGVRLHFAPFQVRTLRIHGK